MKDKSFYKKFMGKMLDVNPKKVKKEPIVEDDYQEEVIKPKSLLDTIDEAEIDDLESVNHNLMNEGFHESFERGVEILDEDVRKFYHNFVNEDESHYYSDVPENAQPEVKKAIERWRNLPIEERKDQVLLWWLLGSGTPPYKMPPKDALYVDESKNNNSNCGNCEYLYIKTSNGHHICSQISGDVNPNGWCKLWKKAIHNHKVKTIDEQNKIFCIVKEKNND